MCMYREAFTISRKNVALLQNSRKKLVIVLLDNNRWRAVQCSPQCTRPNNLGARVGIETRASDSIKRVRATLTCFYHGASYRGCAGNCDVLHVRVSCARVADGARWGKSIRYRVHHPKISHEKSTNSSHKKSDTNLYRSLSKKVTVRDNQ